ncbi:GTP-binding protein Era [Tepidamorphus gemmatus]|jgi:GTP-binding protein Era|uniref:GTPase Era n=1 Tax=Tepidamorphus gemmatus TaxID=747076 RepID=A0A4R3MGN5_9HYPH|nr:GTPase Era [Tepidamorphus gemmatus]TCT11507.1 GTP-binding protein Era [Tepidamorphus gemmatus]
MSDRDESQSDALEAAHRCGFVALIGAPNAGKSTLLNRLVGAKVSIVTHKVQTTRSLVRGIAVRGPAQIVFVDTPGIFRPKRRLDTAMVRSAWAGATDADAVVMIADARKGLDEEAEAILARLRDIPHRRFLALNKIDVMRRDKLLEVTAAFNAALPFERTFMISALTGDGVDDLMAALAEVMPAGPWLYPEDQISDFPLRQLAAEITREKLYLRLHQELPYESHVETETWTEHRDGSVRIEQTIYVARESQRAIVLGKNGRTIKEIGAASREELAAILEVPVHLSLFVKVRESWADDPERYREMGLDFPRD